MSFLGVLKSCDLGPKQPFVTYAANSHFVPHLSSLPVAQQISELVLTAVLANCIPREQDVRPSKRGGVRQRFRRNR